MKRIFSFLALTLVLCSLVSAQDNKKTEAEIIKLEQEFEAAWIKYDMATIDRLSTSDLIIILNSEIRTKAQAISPTVNTASVERTSSMTDMKVRLYGNNTAIFTARWKEVRRNKNTGNERTSEGFMTDTWVKQEGKWLLATGHSSTITPPPQPAK